MSAAIEDDHLFDDLLAFTERYVGWTPEFRLGAVAFAIASWIFRRFQSFPYLQIVGPPGNGKTRSLEVLGALAYRPEMCTATTPAVLYRLVSRDNGCTLLLDEVNGRPTGTALDILRSGFGRTGRVQRCAGADANFEIQEFPCYGPKVIAGQHPLEDGALQSRIITENMGLIVNGRAYKPYLPDTFDQEAAGLVKRIVAWAKANATIDYESVSLPGQLDARGQQVFLPLFTVTPEKHRATLQRLAERHLKYVSRETGDTDDHAVIAALLDKGSPATFYPGEIAEHVNNVRGTAGTSDAIGPRKAGRCLSRLGFCPGARTPRGIPYVAVPGQIASVAESCGVGATS